MPVYPRAEVGEIGRWAADHGIWVLTDEIYEHLVYGGAEFSSIPVEVPETRDRCVVVNSVAKTYAMTGWRVGWMVGPPDVAAAVGRLQSHSTSNIANVSQFAALAALEGAMDAVWEMRAAFDRRRVKMYEMLRAIPGVSVLEPEGAIYAFPQVTLDQPLGERTPTTTFEYAATLLELAEIAVVPGEPFGASRIAAPVVCARATTISSPDSTGGAAIAASERLDSTSIAVDALTFDGRHAHRV